MDIGASLTRYSVNEFLDNVLPPLRKEINVKQTVEALKRGKDPAIHNGRWKWFPTNPADMKTREDITFRPLEQLVNVIAKGSKMGNKHRLLYFENNPNATPESQNRESTSLPDGYFVIPDGDARMLWSNVALSAEYKRHNKEMDKHDNVTKVVWSMQECLREDPCRRFTYGLTIENTDMRMWFASRGGPIVSEPIDFTTEHEKVVEFVLRFMYAEKHEVGWDRTIKRVPDDVNGLSDGKGEPRYDITVRTWSKTRRRHKETTYRTMETISDRGANRLRGRGTRVWKARKLVDGQECGDPVVVKDCWIDSNQDREGDVLHELAQSPSQPADDGYPFTEWLLTVLDHGDVYIGDQCDTTDAPTKRGCRIARQMEPSSQLSVQPPLTCQYECATHYRIVFKEVCQTLQHMTSLQEILVVLAQAAIALLSLHQRGWVHRDISTGNLLCYNTQLKLSDFEYAKRWDTSTTHEIRTGTAQFMAVEVDQQEYGFPPGLPLAEKAVTTNLASLRKNIRFPNPRPKSRSVVAESASDPDQRPKVDFRYNPMHDLESVWWIGIYFMFTKCVVGIKKDSDLWNYALQKRLAQDIFYTRMGREPALMEPKRLLNGMDAVHTDLKDVCAHLERIRTHLVDCYRRVEASLPLLDLEAMNGLHEQCAALFMDARSNLQNDVILADFGAGVEEIVADEKPASALKIDGLDASKQCSSKTNKKGRGQGLVASMVNEDIASPVGASTNLRPSGHQHRKRLKQSNIDTLGSRARRPVLKRRTKGPNQSADVQDITPGIRKSVRLQQKKAVCLP